MDFPFLRGRFSGFRGCPPNPPLSPGVLSLLVAEVLLRFAPQLRLRGPSGGCQREMCTSTRNAHRSLAFCRSTLFSFRHTWLTLRQGVQVQGPSRGRSMAHKVCSTYHLSDDVWCCIFILLVAFKQKAESSRVGLPLWGFLLWRRPVLPFCLLFRPDLCLFAETLYHPLLSTCVRYAGRYAAREVLASFLVSKQIIQRRRRPLTRTSRCCACASDTLRVGRVPRST